MSANLSEEVTALSEDCDVLLSAIEEQGPAVEQAVLDLVRTGGTEVGEGVDLLATFQVFGQQLQSTLDQLVERDLELHDVETERSLTSRRRLELIAQLDDQLRGLRQYATGFYTNPDLLSLGLAAPNPRRSAKLLRRLELAYRKLTGPAAEQLLGEKRFATSVPPTAQAEEIQPAIEELRGLLDTLRRLKRRGDSLRADRLEHKVDHGRFFTRTARMFEDFCRFAGKLELAERVRPSNRRPGRLLGDGPGDDGAGGGDPGGTGGPGASPGDGGATTPPEDGPGADDG